jgi:glycosyltransferase involved in cell wall biosynthesis
MHDQRNHEYSGVSARPENDACLLVILHDRLSDLVEKGEITARYYNPGDVFKKVSILLLNDDSPDPASIQQMVGSADLCIYNLPARRSHWLRAPFWLLGSLNAWSARAVRIARTVQPTIVRCYGASLNSFAAFQIHVQTGVPYVISIHRQVDDDADKKAITPTHRILDLLVESVSRVALRSASCVLPAYRSILPYLNRRGVGAVRLAYNAVDIEFDEPKSSYAVGSKVRIISVGRQIGSKDPSSIIGAVALLQDVHLTLVGSGPLHAGLRALVEATGLTDRVEFVPRVLNRDLAQRLRQSDIFVIQTAHAGVPKTVIEASLCGLPIVVAGRAIETTPELQGGWALLTPDSPDSLSETIRRLISDVNARREAGEAARRFAVQTWRPRDAEEAVATIYRKILADSQVSAQ